MNGLDIIKNKLASISNRPGIYQYLNSKNEGFKKIQIDSYENVYSHEIETLSKCILENKREPDFPGFTINDTLENMKILDKWLN